jgi:hypothetical protein
MVLHLSAETSLLTVSDPPTINAATAIQVVGARLEHRERQADI